MIKEYLIAVSGGPDSMALLDMAYKRAYNLYVLHVNYHKRPTCNKDEMIVRNYCNLRGIPIYVKHFYDFRGNFQDAARKGRYDFFCKIANLINVNKILMAHNLDDFLETVFMQIKRGSKSECYGIKAISNYKTLAIYRPLLSFEKASLEKYCIDNHIEYGIDESNYSLIYKRNYYRHQVLNKYSYYTKLNLYLKINKINRQIRNLYHTYRLIYQKDCFKMTELNNIKNIKLFLRTKLYYDLSDKYLDELLRQLFNVDSFVHKVKDKLLVKDRGIITFLKDYQYHYLKYDLRKIENKYFKMVDKSDNFHSCLVKEADFPITIRPFKKGDKIKLRYGNKSIASYFKDKKINLADRITYPVILNKDNEIIFVPGIGANVTHFNTKANLFMLEYKNTEE